MIIKNIIWDWNGTIINDAYLFVDIMNTTLKKYRLPLITLQDYKNNFCFPIQKYWKTLGFKFNARQFQTMNKTFIALYESKMKEPCLQKGALRVLDFAKQRSFNQFVLSASEHKILNKMVSFYNVDKYFYDILGVNNLNATGKIELARSLMQNYNLNPLETVVIGDTLYDKEVSCSINSHLVLVACGHFNKKRLIEKNNVVVDKLIEIIPLLS